jgi:signal transduction histidine kinase
MNKQTLLRFAILSSAVVGISLLHYLTPLHLPMLHDIFQRLYYIPIILAAFWFGFRGGLSSAIVVSVLYAPHILFQWGGHLTMELEKYLEIILYNVVGSITGLLSQKERDRASQLQETARGLEESNEQLRRQSELILEIEGQMRRAERLSVLGELSAALAHEIRNPLGAIKGAAEILRDDYRPDDRKYEFLEILVGETERLDRVVEDFLRLARPRASETGECDVMEELRNMITLVSAEARRRGVELRLEPAALPPVTGDREKLRQAFLNIILNGLQATPSGGSVIISASSDAAGNQVEISFSDTGAGILPDVRARIFDPFFTTKEGGTGLGLAITEKIITGHGGSIGVESSPGRGATVKVTIPVRGGSGW